MLVLGLLAVSVALAACGSSSSSTTTSASSGSSATASSTSGRFDRTALAACLKKHGVTLPSRPAGSGAPAGGAPPAGGGGFFGGGGTGSGRGGFFRNNPKFAAAFKACGGGNFRGRVGGHFKISHTTIDKYVSCVRSHGYPQMPNPNFSGTGGVFPTSIRSNPKFLAASRSCQSILVPARPSGTPGSSA